MLLLSHTPYKGIKLCTAMLLFSLIKMAYPAVRDELLAAIAADPSNLGLQTLLYLCEFFIPVARDLYFCLATNDFNSFYKLVLPRAAVFFMQLNNPSYCKACLLMLLILRRRPAKSSLLGMRFQPKGVVLTRSISALSGQRHLVLTF